MAPLDTTFRAAPLDRAARLAIAGAAGLIGIILWWLVGTATDAPGPLLLQPTTWLAAGLLVLIVPALLGDWLRAPTSYSVEGGEVRIHRRHAKDVRFVVTGDVERFREATDLRRRGIFYGCRWIPESSRSGMRNPFREEGPSIYVAATDLTRAVRIEIPNGTAIVTPSDPDAFLAAASWHL